MASAQVKQEIICNRHLTNRQIESLLGVNKKCIQRVLKKHGLSRPSGINVGKASKVLVDKMNDGGESFKCDGDTAEQVIITTKPVKTIADLIKSCEIDTTVWKVDRFECGAWTTGMKIKTGNVETPKLVQQWRVKVYLKRIQPKHLEDASNIIFDRLAKYSKSSVTFRKPVKDEHLGIIGLFDAHFGKLCWGEETGTDYDLKIAEELFHNAIVDLVDRSKHMNIGRFMLPLGNDIYEMDNSRNTTFGGTALDVDGRYAKIIAAGEMAVIKAIDYARTVAPVDVVHIPGNHDQTTSFHLARTVKAWYRNCNDVTVDVTPPKRKYYRWNKILIGMTHGEKEKKHDLIGLMALERPKDWAETETREWLLGHDHRYKQFQSQNTDTHQGVVIRVLRSLSGTNGWHHENGYVGTKQAAEMFWYDKENYVGHTIHTVRK